MKIRYVLLFVLILNAVVPVYGSPTIQSYSNNISSDIYPVVDYLGNVSLEVSCNETITLYRWFTDGVNQSNNYDNLTESWNSTGYKTVTVNGTNANGTTQTITWHPYVRMEMASPSDTIAPVSTVGYNELLDEIGSSEPDIIDILWSTALPYTDIIGNVFFVLLYGIPVVMQWIRQESMLFPSLWGIVLGVVLFSFWPSNYVTTASALIVLSVVSVIYMLYKERR